MVTSFNNSTREIIEKSVVKDKVIWDFSFNNRVRAHIGMFIGHIYLEIFTAYITVFLNNKDRTKVFKLQKLNNRRKNG